MIEMIKGYRSKFEGIIDEREPFIIRMETLGKAVYSNWCVCLDSNEKLIDARYLVYKNHYLTPDNSICFDNEQFIVELCKLPKEVNKLVSVLVLAGMVR